MELFDFIKDIKNGTMAEICYIADVNIPKKAGLGKVQKYVVVNVQIGYSYQNAVNARIERNGGEGNFVAESLPWGEWEIVNKVIKNKGERYLRFYEVNNKNTPKVVYMVDGDFANAEQTKAIKAYLADHKKNEESKKQSEAGLVEKQVKPKNVKFSGIQWISSHGEVFTPSRMSEVA